MAAPQQAPERHQAAHSGKNSDRWGGRMPWPKEYFTAVFEPRGCSMSDMEDPVDQGRRVTPYRAHL